MSLTHSNTRSRQMSEREALAFIIGAFVSYFITEIIRKVRK